MKLNESRAAGEVQKEQSSNPCQIKDSFLFLEAAVAGSLCRPLAASPLKELQLLL